MALSLFLASCCNVLTVEVRNTLNSDRHPEMVEIDLDAVTDGLGLKDGETFVVKDSDGNEVPYQTTYAGKLIFPVSVKASSESIFTVSRGVPSEVQTYACGNQYPDKDDDLAWENDVVGFRIYGHKLDVPSGYDLFAKRGTDLPVLESFYANERYGSKAWERYFELEKTDPSAAFRFKMDTLSYHVDRGYGMDCYGVGPTLGAGVAALMEEDKILYPYCYDSFEILDNGPLRFTVKLGFRPFAAGTDEDVAETRIITLDRGSHFNRTEVSYSGLSEAKDIVAGIVLQDKLGNEVASRENGYVSYPAPTINVDTENDVDNGTLYVANVFPSELKDARTVYFSDEESASRNNTKGHVLAFGSYVPESVFTYYWGFGWNHSDVADYPEWIEYVDAFAKQVREPLVVNLK